MGRLVFGASAYFVWQERNLRVFKKGSRNVDQLYKCIFNTVRLKILTLRLKKSSGFPSLLERWKIEPNTIV